MHFRDKIIRMFRRVRISGLMNYIVATVAIFYILDLFLASRGFDSYSLFGFSRSMILSGQIWRIITFIALPPNSSILWIVFSLFFYWLIGTTLENSWGRAEFFSYYLVGTVLTIIGGFITGYTYNYYLNYSLFFAYATLFPRQQFRIYFIIPITAKAMGIAVAVLMAIAFVLGDFSAKVSILMAAINYLIFFGPEIITPIINRIKYREFRSVMKKRK